MISQFILCYSIRFFVEPKNRGLQQVSRCILLRSMVQLTSLILYGLIMGEFGKLKMNGFDKPKN